MTKINGWDLFYRVHDLGTLFKTGIMKKSTPVNTRHPLQHQIPVIQRWKSRHSFIKVDAMDGETNLP